ncbi:MAG: hypothetical protein R2684_03325 [Pyrinomonadaceae bacterium]
MPVGYGLGLGCAIFSYDQVLYFGFSSDEGAMPDVDRFKHFSDEVYGELLALAASKIKTNVATSAE